jgi:hypothetical protein
VVKLRLGVILAIAMLFFATRAKADQFDLTAEGLFGTNISLTLTGTAVAPGEFDITSASGTVDGVGATLLPTWFFGNDNLLYTNSPYFDAFGLGLYLANGSFGDLFGVFGGDLYLQLGSVNIGDILSVQVTEAPEPGTLVLIASGLLALGLLAMRKQFA